MYTRRGARAADAGADPTGTGGETIPSAAVREEPAAIDELAAPGVPIVAAGALVRASGTPAGAPGAPARSPRGALMAPGAPAGTPSAGAGEAPGETSSAACGSAVETAGTRGSVGPMGAGTELDHPGNQKPRVWGVLDVGKGKGGFVKSEMTRHDDPVRQSIETSVTLVMS